MLQTAGFRQKGVAARPPTARAVERRLVRLPRSHVDRGQKARDERRQAAASISVAKTPGGGGEFILTPPRGATSRESNAPEIL